MKKSLSLALWLLCAASASHAADCQPQTQIDVATIKPQIILVGETHGTEQAPAFVGGLICSLLQAGRPVVLALERQDTEQEALSRYIDSDGGPTARQALLKETAWAWTIQDGRNSQAVLKLIDSLRRQRAAGQRVGILAIQHFVSLQLPRVEAGMPPMREANLLASRMNDRFMADTLASAASTYPDFTFVAIAGSYHTATRPMPDAGLRHQPMGQVLADLLPIFVIGLATAEGGSSWNCRSMEDCGSHRGGPFEMYLPGNQIDAVVQLGKISASPPAKAAQATP